MDSQANIEPSITHPNPVAAIRRSVFQADLRQATESFYPGKQSPYRKIFVFLVSWANAPEYDEELHALEETFRGIYNFQTAFFKIPINVVNKHQLNLEFGKAMGGLDKYDLFIFYYAGHAYHEFDKSKSWNTERPLKIASNAFKVGRFADESADSFEYRTRYHVLDLQAIIHFNSFKPESSTANDPDVLIILDCCYAGSEAITGKFELLAACGINSVTPGPGTMNSFTVNLIDTLRSSNGIPATVAQTHSALVRKYYVGGLTTTPFHVELSEKMLGKGSIVLAPLRPEGSAISPHLRDVRPFMYEEKSTPTVLLSVTLSDVNSPPDPQQWANWLSTNLPPEVADVKIEIKGFFRTQSGLLMISMPVEVWSTLRGRKAYCFHGFQFPEGQSAGGLSMRDRRKENIPLSGGRRVDETSK